jgi:hypothetical protein
MKQCVTEDQLVAIIAKIEAHGACNAAYLNELTVDYPHLRFTLCSDHDMGVKEPFRECSFFDCHLVSLSQSGCSSITSHVDHCSGLVIALHEE